MLLLLGCRHCSAILAATAAAPAMSSAQAADSSLAYSIARLLLQSRYATPC